MFLVVFEDVQVVLKVMLVVLDGKVPDVCREALLILNMVPG